eukprot:m.359819 g.359819  ORF g.359819 m.359819 type:complete len:142 (+) comp20764_c0_seq1:97-522(+)
MRGTAVARGFLSNEASSLPRWIRNILTMHPDQTPWLQYTKDRSTRSPPHPNLDGLGPAHKLSNNYYYKRDVKREVRPVFRIGNTEATPFQLMSQVSVDSEDGKETSTEIVATVPEPMGPVFAGRGFKWKQGDPTTDGTDSR